MKKVYIAAPFFNREQLTRVSNIETILAREGIAFFSPRSLGVLKDLSPAERDEASSIIFNKNVEMLDWCDIVIAVIDDKDTGTIWEMGYGKGKGKKIIAFTSYPSKPVNLMLARSCFAYLKGYNAMDDAAMMIATDRVDGLPFITEPLTADT